MQDKIVKFSLVFINIMGLMSMLWIIFTMLWTPVLSPIASEWRYLNDLDQIKSENFLAFIFSVFIVLSILWINKKIKISYKQGLAVTLSLALIYFLFLMFQYQYLNITRPIDDTAIVMDAAKEFIETGKVSGWYMSANPQNLITLFVYVIIFKVTSGYNIYNVYLIFAILHVFTSILIYCTAALKKEYFLSVVATLIFMLTIQINLHVLFMYTDILSFFPLMLTLYFLSRYSNKEKQQKKIVNLSIAVVFLSLTFLTKGLYLIFFIALIITLLIFLPKKLKLLVLVPTLSFIFVNLFWNSFISSINILPVEEYGMPNTHYIYMGMNTDYYLTETRREYRLAGGYDHQDLMDSKEMFWNKKMDKSEISKWHIEGVKARLSNKSAQDLLSFFNSKAGSTWSSGDLKSTMSLKLATDKSEKSFEIAQSKYLYFYMQVIQGIYYVIFLLYFLKSLVRRHSDQFYLTCSMFMIGMFFFIFLWESSPRYAMTIMPVALVMMPFLGKRDIRDTYL